MSPTIIVPEIIYPQKKREMIVHHPYNKRNIYNSMFYNKVNPSFLGMAAGNPYWQGFLQNNQAYSELKDDANYKEGMAEIQKIPLITYDICLLSLPTNGCLFSGMVSLVGGVGIRPPN